MPHELTPVLAEAITAFIRAGGYPHVAAEAAGVPRRVFERWLRRGRRRHAPQELQDFARAVLQAHAQARLKAEIAILEHRPLDWLRYGPGKETACDPGWTAAARPGQYGLHNEGNPLLDVRVLTLIRILLDELHDQPDLRARLAPQVLSREALFSRAARKREGPMRPPPHRG